MKYLLICLLLLPLFSSAQQLTKTELQEERQIIKDALNDKTYKQVLVDKVIPDRETAISVAEPILFKVYGKDHIVGEKPYNVHLIDGYWLISGTLPAALPDEDVVGGTFLIIFSSKDGRVIKLMHGK